MQHKDQVVVIFRAQLRYMPNPKDHDEYLEMAQYMRTLAINEFGCLGFYNVTQETDYEGDMEITLSYWPNEEATMNWRKDPRHITAQKIGIEKWYQSYEIDVAKVERSYSINIPHS